MRYELTGEPNVGEWVRITTAREGEVLPSDHDPAYGAVVKFRAKNGLTHWIVLDEDTVVQQIPRPAPEFEENDVVISLGGTAYVRHYDGLWRSGSRHGMTYNDETMAALMRRSWRLLRRGEPVE